MVWKTVMASVALVASLTTAPKVSVPDPALAKRQLLTLEDQWLQGLQDPQVQEQILADDFIHVLPSGIITKKDQLDFLRSGKRPADHLKRRFEDLKVRIYGTAGVVNGMVVAADSSGRVLKRTVFADVFAFRNGRWQAVNAQENEYQPQSH